MKFTYKLLVQKNVKKYYIICPVRFGFQNTYNCQMVQATKLSNHELNRCFIWPSFHGR